MKRKAIALLLSLTMISLSTTAYAADTVQNAPTINSSGKIIIEDTDITIDSKDLPGQFQKMYLIDSRTESV